MRSKTLFCSALGAATLLSSVCFAQCLSTLGEGSCVSAPWGWYVEGNLGTTRISNIAYSVKSDAVGWNLDVGYKFMPYFGLEAGLTNYGKAKYKNDLNQVAATGEKTSFDITTRAILPLGSFEAFGKIGMAFASTEVKLKSGVISPISKGTKNSSGAYLAVGGQYYFSPNLAAHLEWAQSTGNKQTGTLDLWSVGASYLFG